MQNGDIVTRISYHHDTQFRIEDIKNKQARLCGLEYRLAADAAISDLELARSLTEPSNKQHCLVSTNIQVPLFLNEKSLGNNYIAKILHIDGNRFYLKECITLYKRLGIPVIGYPVNEEKQPRNIMNLLNQHKPNIVVITGHDSVSKSQSTSKNLNSYLNSKYFLESIRIARNYSRNYDDLVIIAGGCKSYYEALMEAGANFASSPDRVMINVTEPVLIACKVAITSVTEYLSMESIAENLPSGLSGFGGIETRGQCRRLAPSPYQKK
ncbi:sporulation peptidase YabG [Anaerosporobacter faecicola]|uniref:sporulation peptidase YabG n=1 Tax=Anaerosporobacter faecicola TaxID=2718714 RepID=UPI00143C57CD|nr:sporulation peptidase YabG [Anaerosporobacter faecicola]